MALVDELIVHAKAGDGGNGVVRWLHLKGKEFSGPAGGNGGRGGSVYISGVRDIAILSRYTGTKEFTAGRGGDGESRSRHGISGKDVTIEVPVGSIITNQSTGEVFEILDENEPTMVLAGGRGGVGNEHFKSSINRRPEQSTPGSLGQEADLRIELRLVADAGLVGLPNAGKSSLLNALTNASAKVGSYAFTTLDPNLGAFFGFVLADIPGLIEGASGGKGLGYKFLRHVTRTKMLLHCISLESEDPMRDYEIVRRELEAHSEELSLKPTVVVLTKSDSVSDQDRIKVEKLFLKKGLTVLHVSVLDDDSLKSFRDALVKILRA